MYLQGVSRHRICKELILGRHLVDAVIREHKEKRQERA